VPSIGQAGGCGFASNFRAAGHPNVLVRPPICLSQFIELAAAPHRECLDSVGLIENCAGGRPSRWSSLRAWLLSPDRTQHAVDLISGLLQTVQNAIDNQQRARVLWLLAD
jgi:hypothetical protein